MFPSPTVQAKLQCFQNDSKSPEIQQTPVLQKQHLGLSNITPVHQLQPNISLEHQLQPLRRPNTINTVHKKQSLRQPNIISLVQQQQFLRQPDIISPVQQKLPLLVQPNINPGQQQQSLREPNPVHHKRELQNPVQQEQSPIEVKPIPGQPQKKPVLQQKTLWQRLHPEEDELSLLVKSHYALKEQNSVAKKKKLSVPRQLKKETLQHSTDPPQGIPILKQQAPTLVLQQQTPQPTTTWRQEQIDLQHAQISEEPQPSSGTSKTWQEQLSLLQESPITKPNQCSGQLQHQRPIPRQPKQSTELRQQPKQAEQWPEESLLQIHSQNYQCTREEDTRQNHASKTSLRTKVKKGLQSFPKMFPSPTVQAKLQCFQNDSKSPEIQQTPVLQKQHLGLSNITPVHQLQPNISLEHQLQPLRRPNTINPVHKKQSLRQPNIISLVQQQQFLRQPDIISPVQQKLPLLVQPNINPGQQQQSLREPNPVHHKRELQNPVQQEQSPIEVKPIPGQPQKKPVLQQKTLWQRLHPEEDELSLLVKSHYALKEQNSVAKKKKLSVPRQLKKETLQHSTDPPQGIPILKQQAPTLVLQQQTPQPTTTWRQEQIDLQHAQISEEPQPSSGTSKTWQEQLSLLQESPITKPNQCSGQLQHQRPIPRQPKQSTELRQQPKQAEQWPEESLLQIHSQNYQCTREEDTRQNHASKTSLRTKVKKVIASYNAGGGCRKFGKKLAKVWRDNQRLRRLVKPRNAYSVLCELTPVTRRKVSLLPRGGNKQLTAVLTVKGKQYRGSGLTGKEAKSDAAEEVLRLLMKKQMWIDGVADQKPEEIITISDSEDDEDSPISMKQLTSLALYKLFENWKKMEAEQTLAIEHPTPVSAPAGADVDPLASLHPCDLLNRMRGRLPYILLHQQNNPQGTVFFYGVTVDGSTYIGKGTKKKDARFRAAKRACEAVFKVVYP